MTALIATLKADLAAVIAYVGGNYKQLLAAGLVGKFAGAIAAVLAALVKAL